MNGFLIVNKKKNMTSRDVVNIISKKLKTKKVGHTGTLDPLATGVLVIAVNKALKLVEDITALNKEYIAEVSLGIKTDTLDITGEVLEEDKNIDIDENKLIEVLNSFVGKYKMTVPKYSAVKVDGKKLYEYARNNIDVELPTKEVFINSIELLRYDVDKFSFKCNVSKGTYIRSLIDDICKKLGVLGTMSNLKRIKQGDFDIENSIEIDDVNEDTNLISMKEVLKIPLIEVDDELLNKIKNGQKLLNIYNYDKLGFTHNNELISIYITDEKDNSKIKPKNVFC